MKATGNRVVKDDIKDQDVLDAISIAARAQGGSIFDAMKAKKLVEEIENGELSLQLPEKEEGLEID